MIVRAFIVFAAIVAGGMVIIGWRSPGRDAVMPHDMVVPSATSLDFEMPSGTRMLLDSPGARGWTKMGIVPDTFERTVRFVSGKMIRAGFRSAHRVESPQGQNRILEEWHGKAGQKVLWMVWKVSDGETGFSWGRETR